MNRKEKKNLQQLYHKMDGIAEYNEAEIDTDVKKLHQVSDKKDLADSLKQQGDMQGYQKAVQEMLDLAYEYYQLTGELPQEVVGEKLVLDDLIESYYRRHAISFNPVVQENIHRYLVDVSPLLQQLEHTALVEPTIVQYQRIKENFAAQLQFLEQHGFALDLDFYNTDIAPVWLPLKMSRQVVAKDFVLLVKVLDHYSRLETGHERQVVYRPDDLHQTPAQEPAQLTEQQQARQKEEQEKQAKRMAIKRDESGHVKITLPDEL